MTTPLRGGRTSGRIRRAVRASTPSWFRRQARLILSKLGIVRNRGTRTAARGPAATGTASDIDRLYAQMQTADPVEVPASVDELEALADNWKGTDLPQLQRRIADAQLAALSAGTVDPVFTALVDALKQVELPRFSILDAACATGYYSEVIRRLDPRPIEYTGCDYSAAMIESAREHYPGVPFLVEDLTSLTLADASFDVVLLSGVLEHIPDYRRAIKEAARVARQYLIVHRCPTTSGAAHERLIGGQYSIRTPRTYFSRQLLESEFAAAGLERVASIDVYPKRSGAAQANTRRTLTLVFRRREP